MNPNLRKGISILTPLLQIKDENVQRFALSALRGELLERERQQQIDMTPLVK